MQRIVSAYLMREALSMHAAHRVRVPDEGGTQHAPSGRQADLIREALSMHPVVVRRDHLVPRLREERDANQVQSSTIKRSQMQSSAIDVREERDGDANRGPLRRP